MNNIVDKDIKILKFNINLINKCNENKIFLVNDLWSLNRKELKRLGFNFEEIKEIIIKLQLNGLDLNRKVTK
ncbi:MAG: hypothetical protein IJ574_04740 [Bacilli bacterium]|nr:hypothetical protein [Bacilli bacterium]